MQCRDCGCTDQSPCPGGCVWVQADLCSSCLPHDIEFQCSEGHEFTATMQESYNFELPGGRIVEAVEDIECPECGSTKVLDQYLEKESVN